MSTLTKIKNFVLRRTDPTSRVEGAFNRLSTEAGLTPLYKDSMVEVRRKEIIDTLHDLNEMEFAILKKKSEKGESVEIVQQITDYQFKAFKLAKLFQTFFIVGDPWTRGLDNGTLSKVVADFISQFEDVGHLSGFVNMLTSEAFHMIHLSWQKLDVDILPPMLLSSQPLLINQPNRGTPQYQSAGSDANQGPKQE